MLIFKNSSGKRANLLSLPGKLLLIVKCFSIASIPKGIDSIELNESGV